MKEWQCVQVGHHKDVGKIIMDWERRGWRLHGYQASGLSSGNAVNHYLLFERGE